MRVVVAPDSFKESLSAIRAADAISRGVGRVAPEAECVRVPMADGGEGFTAAMAVGLGAAIRPVAVRDALGRPSEAELALAGDLAVLEVASTVGLGQIAPAERDIRHAASGGVGLLIRAALDAGASHLVIGLGGSATSDAGAGMLADLGVRFLDGNGDPVVPDPAHLTAAVTIDETGLDPRIAGVTIEAACDVTNPLTGPTGAAAVYGPQKGAGPGDVAFLDEVATHLARLAARPGTAEIPGAGAAGGLGWALTAFLGARLVPGADLVARTCALPERIAGADLVLTGEGSVDAQTLHGKAVAGVARVAEEAGVPCVVLAGRVSPDADVLLDHGITALVPIVPGPVPLAEALADAATNLERTAATVVRLWSHIG